MARHESAQLARRLAQAASRRGMLARLAALPLGVALVALLDEEESEAGRRKRRKARHRHRARRRKAARKRKQRARRKGKNNDNGKPPVCSGCSATQLCDGGVCQTCDVCASGCAHETVGSAIGDPALYVGNEAIVHICAGTYTEPIHINQIDRQASVTLIGAGSGEDGTILHGAGGSVVQIEGPFSDNASLFVTLRALRITGGVGAANAGGGISAVMLPDAGSLTLTDCVVTENQGGSGGGIYNDEGQLTLNASTVTGNGSADSGGGINNQGGKVVLNQSIVSSNNAANGGGGIFNQGGQLTLTDTSVIGNAVEDELGDGGGIFNLGGTVTLQGSSSVTGNTPDNCFGTPACGN